MMRRERTLLPYEKINIAIPKYMELKKNDVFLSISRSGTKYQRPANDMNNMEVNQLK